MEGRARLTRRFFGLERKHSKESSESFGIVHAPGRSDAEQLMTLEEVAQYLNVDKFTVYRLIAGKKLILGCRTSRDQPFCEGSANGVRCRS